MSRAKGSTKGTTKGTNKEVKVDRANVAKEEKKLLAILNETLPPEKVRAIKASDAAFQEAMTAMTKSAAQTTRAEVNAVLLAANIAARMKDPASAPPRVSPQTDQEREIERNLQEALDGYSLSSMEEGERHQIQDLLQGYGLSIDKSRGLEYRCHYKVVPVHGAKTQAQLESFLDEHKEHHLAIFSVERQPEGLSCFYIEDLIKYIKRVSNTDSDASLQLLSEEYWESTGVTVSGVRFTGAEVLLAVQWGAAYAKLRELLADTSTLPDGMRRSLLKVSSALVPTQRLGRWRTFYNQARGLLRGMWHLIGMKIALDFLSRCACVFALCYGYFGKARDFVEVAWAVSEGFLGMLMCMMQTYVSSILESYIGPALTYALGAFTTALKALGFTHLVTVVSMWVDALKPENIQNKYLKGAVIGGTYAATAILKRIVVGGLMAALNPMSTTSVLVGATAVFSTATLLPIAIGAIFSMYVGNTSMFALPATQLSGGGLNSNIVTILLPALTTGIACDFLGKIFGRKAGKVCSKSASLAVQMFLNYAILNGILDLLKLLVRLTYPELVKDYSKTSCELELESLLASNFSKATLQAAVAEQDARVRAEELYAVIVQEQDPYLKSKLSQEAVSIAQSKYDVAQKSLEASNLSLKIAAEDVEKAFVPAKGYTIYDKAVEEASEKGLKLDEWKLRHELLLHYTEDKGQGLEENKELDFARGQISKLQREYDAARSMLPKNEPKTKFYVLGEKTEKIRQDLEEYKQKLEVDIIQRNAKRKTETEAKLETSQAKVPEMLKKRQEDAWKAIQHANDIKLELFKHREMLKVLEDNQIYADDKSKAQLQEAQNTITALKIDYDQAVQKSEASNELLKRASTVQKPLNTEYSFKQTMREEEIKRQIKKEYKPRIEKATNQRIEHAKQAREEFYAAKVAANETENELESMRTDLATHTLELQVLEQKKYEKGERFGKKLNKELAAAQKHVSDLETQYGEKLTFFEKQKQTLKEKAQIAKRKYTAQDTSGEKPSFISHLELSKYKDGVVQRQEKEEQEVAQLEATVAQRTTLLDARFAQQGAANQTATFGSTLDTDRAKLALLTEYQQYPAIAALENVTKLREKIMATEQGYNASVLEYQDRKNFLESKGNETITDISFPPLDSYKLAQGSQNPKVADLKNRVLEIVKESKENFANATRKAQQAAKRTRTLGSALELNIAQLKLLQDTNAYQGLSIDEDKTEVNERQLLITNLEKDFKQAIETLNKSNDALKTMAQNAGEVYKEIKAYELNPTAQKFQPQTKTIAEYKDEATTRAQLRRETLDLANARVVFAEADMAFEQAAINTQTLQKQLHEKQEQLKDLMDANYEIQTTSTTTAYTSDSILFKKLIGQKLELERAVKEADADYKAATVDLALKNKTRDAAAKEAKIAKSTLTPYDQEILKNEAQNAELKKLEEYRTARFKEAEFRRWTETSEADRAFRAVNVAAEETAKVGKRLETNRAKLAILTQYKESNPEVLEIENVQNLEAQILDDSEKFDKAHTNYDTLNAVLKKEEKEAHMSFTPLTVYNLGQKLPMQEAQQVQDFENRIQSAMQLKADKLQYFKNLDLASREAFFEQRKWGNILTENSNKLLILETANSDLLIKKPLQLESKAYSNFLKERKNLEAVIEDAKTQYNAALNDFRNKDTNWKIVEKEAMLLGYKNFTPNILQNEDKQSNLQKELANYERRILNKAAQRKREEASYAVEMANKANITKINLERDLQISKAKLDILSKSPLFNDKEIKEMHDKIEKDQTALKEAESNYGKYEKWAQTEEKEANLNLVRFETSVQGPWDQELEKFERLNKITIDFREALYNAKVAAEGTAIFAKEIKSLTKKFEIFEKENQDRDSKEMIEMKRINNLKIKELNWNLQHNLDLLKRNNEKLKIAAEKAGMEFEPLEPYHSNTLDPTLSKELEQYEERVTQDADTRKKLEANNALAGVNSAADETTKLGQKIDTDNAKLMILYKNRHFLDNETLGEMKVKLAAIQENQILYNEAVQKYQANLKLMEKEAQEAGVICKPLEKYDLGTRTQEEEVNEFETNILTKVEVGKATQAAKNIVSLGEALSLKQEKLEFIQEFKRSMYFLDEYDETREMFDNQTRELESEVENLDAQYQVAVKRLEASKTLIPKNEFYNITTLIPKNWFGQAMSYLGFSNHLGHDPTNSKKYQTDLAEFKTKFSNNAKKLQMDEFNKINDEVYKVDQDLQARREQLNTEIDKIHDEIGKNPQLTTEERQRKTQITRRKIQEVKTIDAEITNNSRRRKFLPKPSVFKRQKVYY